MDGKTREVGRTRSGMCSVKKEAKELRHPASPSCLAILPRHPASHTLHVQSGQLCVWGGRRVVVHGPSSIKKSILH